MKPVSRRKFIAGAAAISAITILKPQTVFGTKSNSAVRVGIIGCGNRGTEVLSEMIKNTPTQAVAMADLYDYQAEKAKQKISKLNVEKGLVSVESSRIFTGEDAAEKLMNCNEVDVVLISSPAYTHPGFLEGAINAGKHVYCEKPVAPDVSGCRQVIRSGELAGNQLSIVIGFQIRHATPYMEMARRIQQGDIGQITSVQLYYISSRIPKVIPRGDSAKEFMIRNHFHFTELSGGILLDQGIHMIDVCNWILNDKPVEATGSGNRKGGPDFGDTFTNYQIIYNYPTDIAVSLHCSQLGPKFGDVCARFIGTKGVAEAHYGLGVFIDGENPWDSGILRGQKPTPEQQAAGVFTSALYDSTQNKVRNFIRSIESGIHINEALSGAISTLSAIIGREAAVTGTKMNWEEVLKLNQKFNAGF
jgi:predicted dehydrogenase